MSHVVDLDDPRTADVFARAKWNLDQEMRASTTANWGRVAAQYRRWALDYLDQLDGPLSALTLRQDVEHAGPGVESAG